MLVQVCYDWRQREKLRYLLRLIIRKERHPQRRDRWAEFSIFKNKLTMHFLKVDAAQAFLLCLLSTQLQTFYSLNPGKIPKIPLACISTLIVILSFYFLTEIFTRTSNSLMENCINFILWSMNQFIVKLVIHVCPVDYISSGKRTGSVLMLRRCLPAHMENDTMVSLTLSFLMFFWITRNSHY